MDNNLQLGQDAYYINQEKVYVVRIVAIIRKETKDGEIVKYEIMDYNGKTREVSQAFLVEDFDFAKEISKQNWYKIVEQVTKQINEQKKITFDEARSMYEEAKKKALEEKRKNDK